MKKNSFLSYFSLIFTGVFLCFSVYAEMYKWVDEGGNTHYTQQKPSGDITTEVIDPLSTVDSKSAQKDISDNLDKADKLREERIKKSEDKMKAEQDLTKKKEQCEKARASQASYERPRINYVDDDGNRRRGSEEERLKDLAVEKENVNKYCNY